MFVGQNPSFQGGDVTGINFSGKSGKAFFSILERNQLMRERLYITNVIKCAGDLDNMEDEKKRMALETCFPYFLTEISMVSPRLVVSLGKSANRICSTLSTSKEEYSPVGVPKKTFWYTHFPLHHPSYYINYNHQDEMEVHLNTLFDWIEEFYPLLLAKRID